MAARTRKIEPRLLDDRIDILNKDSVEASPQEQVFRTVNTILALVRVSAYSAPGFRLKNPLTLITQPGQDG